MSIIEQLSEYCDCLDEVNEQDVEELIHLISSYTCWSQSPCETFLQSERKEVKELPDCADDCDVYVFEPFYTPFDPESFTFTLIEQNGIEETSTPITSYVYSMADENFRIELGLPDCKCKPKCGCESHFKLLVTYVAGFEELPECLLPLFCDALALIREKNDCECEKCEPCDATYVEPSPIDDTKIEGRLRIYFLETLTKQYFRQLGLISLCRARHDLWGFVV